VTVTPPPASSDQSKQSLKGKLVAKILMVLTSADRLSLRDGTQRPTGFWAEEFVTPHRALTQAGVDVTIATPAGRPAPVDEGSLTPEVNGGDADKVAELRAYLGQVAGQLRSPARLQDIYPAEFDGVVVPGGHGPMQDLAVDPDLARILATMLPDPSKIVASLCHGLRASSEQARPTTRGCSRDAR
jgi:putative intracellular protease/amidase